MDSELEDETEKVPELPPICTDCGADLCSTCGCCHNHVGEED